MKLQIFRNDGEFNLIVRFGFNFEKETRANTQGLKMLFKNPFKSLSWVSGVIPPNYLGEFETFEEFKEQYPEEFI